MADNNKDDKSTIKPALSDDDVRRRLRSLENDQERKYVAFVHFIYEYDTTTQREITQEELGTLLNLKQATISESLNFAFQKLHIPLGRWITLDDSVKRIRAERLIQISRIVKAEIPRESLPSLRATTTTAATSQPNTSTTQANESTMSDSESMSGQPEFAAQSTPDNRTAEQKRDDILAGINAGGTTTAQPPDRPPAPPWRRLGIWAASLIALLLGGILIGRFLVPAEPSQPVSWIPTQPATGLPQVVEVTRLAETTRIVEQTVEVDRPVPQTVIVPQTVVVTSPPQVITIMPEPATITPFPTDTPKPVFALPFIDTFDVDKRKEWRVVGSVRVQDGRLTSSTPATILVGDETLVNYSMQFKYGGLDTLFLVGPNFRYLRHRWMGGDRCVFEIQKDGNWSQDVIIKCPPASGTFQITVTGNHFVIKEDEEVVTNFTEEGITPRGPVGFALAAGDWIDDFRLTSP